MNQNQQKPGAEDSDQWEITDTEERRWRIQLTVSIVTLVCALTVFVMSLILKR